ncbi:pectate lyase [Paraflavisolibacter sp. H34]|uniref:pectate lyase n=1 Tax=Huijunlia imazamoxiresistens TaxID=3127457 RepID=UPI0030165457
MQIFNDASSRPRLRLPVSKLSFLAGLLLLQAAGHAQTTIDAEAFGDNSRHWYGIADKSNIINPRPGQPRYKPSDLAAVGDNILLYQRSNGGWPKNYDVFAILTEDQKDSLKAAKNQLHTTFDNGTTYTHVDALADVYAATHADKYKEAALRGLDFILEAQYKNGGWPQYYPLENNYSRRITYNDGGMLGILKLLRAIHDGDPKYAFVEGRRRQQLVAAYRSGLDCVLKSQIREGETLTAWCQQHDEKSLAPAWARAFEPPGICNAESSGIVLFLMSIDKPGKDIIKAVQSAVTWFEASKIYNTKVKTISAPPLQTPFRRSVADRVVVVDSTAPPIWTRYYELKTHRPLFCNRDSKVVYSLAEVDRERRDGYAWYSYAPQQVLDRYAAWQKKWAK